MDKKQMDYQNGYIAQKYDRINVTIPKGLKEYYRQQAAEEGKSLNAIINQLLQDWAGTPTTGSPAAGTQNEEQPTRETAIKSLNFISATSAKKLEEMGISTIGEYAVRYYDDDPENQLTVEEEDQLDDFMIEHRLW